MVRVEGMKTLEGKDADLSKYQGKVVVFVNVASFCGYTKQYTQLQALHEKYGKDGLVILGVPANEFGAQEPGSDAEIAKFCSTKYGVKFPMLSKVVVKGAGICPLYRQLTAETGDIEWNFTKFLIARDGSVAGRFEPATEPESAALTGAIEAELAK